MTVNVLEYLENQAQRFPDKIVFGDIKEELTYRELMILAKKAGTYLSSFHLRNQPIAVITNHSVGCLIAFLGVVYSGNFYVPLDEKQPQARMKAMLTVADPKVIIVPDKKDIPCGLENRILVSREELQSVEIREETLAGIRRNHLDTDPLYLMFTSGSTGVPKGVLVAHRSVIDLAEQFAGVFHFDAEEIFANQAPFDFDVSVKDIYSTLRNGASMFILPQSMFTTPKKLVSFLSEKRITTCIWAVSALSILAAMKVWDKGVPLQLKKILFSGEVMPIKVLNYWRKYQPQAMYVNLYGPTEITCNCTYYLTGNLVCGRRYRSDKLLAIHRYFCWTMQARSRPRVSWGKSASREAALRLAITIIVKRQRKSFARILAIACFRTGFTILEITADIMRRGCWNSLPGGTGRLSIWAIG